MKNVAIAGTLAKKNNRSEHVEGFFEKKSSLYRAAYLRYRFHPIRFYIKRPWKLLLLIRSLIHDIRLIKKADLVYTAPLQYGEMAMAVKIANFFIKPVVVDYYVSALLTLEDRGDSEKCWIGSEKQCRYYDSLALLKSTVLIHPTKSEIEVTADLLGLDSKKIKVSVLPLMCYPFSFKARKCLPNSLRLVWWASFTPLHGVELVFKAIKLLKNKYRNHLIKLDLLGVHQNQTYLKRLVSEYNVGSEVDLRFDKSFLDGSLPKYVKNNFNLALGHFGRSPKSRCVISNKIIEALSLGMPVMTGESSGTSEFICQSEALFVENSAEGIFKGLQMIITGKVSIQELNEKSSEVFDRVFDPKHFDHQFERCLQDSLGAPAHVEN